MQQVFAFFFQRHFSGCDLPNKRLSSFYELLKNLKIFLELLTSVQSPALVCTSARAFLYTLTIAFGGRSELGVNPLCMIFAFCWMVWMEWRRRDARFEYFADYSLFDSPPSRKPHSFRTLMDADQAPNFLSNSLAHVQDYWRRTSERMGQLRRRSKSMPPPMPVDPETQFVFSRNPQTIRRKRGRGLSPKQRRFARRW